MKIDSIWQSVNEGNTLSKKANYAILNLCSVLKTMWTGNSVKAWEPSFKIGTWNNLGVVASVLRACNCIPNYAIPFYIIPNYATPSPNSLSFIIVQTLYFVLYRIILPICGYRGPLWAKTNFCYEPTNLSQICSTSFLIVTRLRHKEYPWLSCDLPGNKCWVLSGTLRNTENLGTVIHNCHFQLLGSGSWRFSWLLNLTKNYIIVVPEHRYWTATKVAQEH